MKIFYREGYSYQLAHKAVFERTGIIPRKEITGPFMKLAVDGTLTIMPGYAWDGASGGVDTKSVIRASLVHDSLYQFMRMGELHKDYRKAADELLIRLMKADGAWFIRRWYFMKAVRWFASSAADPSNLKTVKEAP